MKKTLFTLFLGFFGTFSFSQVTATNDLYSYDDSGSNFPPNPLILDILTNDLGTLDLTTLTITSVVDPLIASLTVNIDGTITVNNWSQDYLLFTYSICDFGSVFCSTGTVELEYLITACGDNLTNDSYNTDMDSPITFDVKTNDDVLCTGGGMLNVSQNPTNGIVVLNFDGTFTYTPNTGFFGQDSFTYTSDGLNQAVVNITVNQTCIPTSSTINPSSCVNYIAPDGQVYSSSGTVTAIIPNTGGCDSTITINLTIKNPTTSTKTITKCASYTAPDGQVYTTSGVKTAIIPNSAGCDSTITINLTINPITVATISASNNNTLITASPSGMVYQWIDCNSNLALTSATNEVVQTISGSYAVVLTNSFACSDTSNCITISNTAFISESNINNEIEVYPNPSSETIFVKSSLFGNLKLTLSDLKGKIILTKTLNSLDEGIDIKSFENGLYFIQIENEISKSVKRFIKN